MSTMKSGGDMLYGVDCDVISCKYHGHSHQCCADSITVEAQNAVNKVQTFCGTFVPRPGSAQ